MRGPRLGRAGLADPTPSLGPAAARGMGLAVLQNGAPCWRPGAAAPHPDPGLSPPSLTRDLGGPHPATQPGWAVHGMSRSIPPHRAGEGAGGGSGERAPAERVGSSCLPRPSTLSLGDNIQTPAPARGDGALTLRWPGPSR